MKKVLLALLLLTSVNMYACHIDPLGWCTGKSFFILKDAQNSEIVEVQYQTTGNTNWITGISQTMVATGSTTLLFNLPQTRQSEPIKVRFRVKSKPNAAWQAWVYGPTASNTIYAACLGLPVEFTYFKVSPVSEKTYKVDFTAAAAEQVTEFRIAVSTDGKTFKTIFIFTPDGIEPNKTYSTLININ